MQHPMVAHGPMQKLQSPSARRAVARQARLTPLRFRKSFADGRFLKTDAGSRCFADSAA